jgi:NhaC family Na+:H+ antiporter
VALMGVGAGLGIDPGMTAGAIVSGSYLGDKLSPLSDTTNLAPAIAEGDLFDHVKSMLYTTTPAYIITLIVYGVLGMRYGGQQLNAESITATLTAIQNSFNMNPVVLIPPVLVIILAIKKFPGLPLLLISALVAAVIAIVFQGQTVTGIAAIMDSGYKSQIGIPAIDSLLSRGGLQNMAWTSLLTIIVMVYGAVLERAGVLEVFINKFKVLTKSVGSLVCATVLSCIGVNLATASQYMSIVIPGRMYIGAYKEKDMLPQTLSRTLEDAGTMTSALVPWNACGVFFAGTLGVATLSYVPFAVLNWVTPLVAITYGFMGKFQWKTGEIPSARTYSKEKLTENL